MTPDERFEELAEILARGVLRLRENSTESAANPLEVSAETRLSVIRVVNGFESLARGERNGTER